eukprot:6665038-Prymnesium_polylepis.3
MDVLWTKNVHFGVDNRVSWMDTLWTSVPQECIVLHLFVTLMCAPNAARDAARAPDRFREALAAYREAANAAKTSPPYQERGT